VSGIKIIGFGKSVPERQVTNEDFTKFMDTSDEWIVSHTGISERRFCREETHTSLCAQAASRALADSGLKASDIGVCLVATVSGEYISPSAACLTQKALGLSADTVCFDVNSGCTGFITALHTAYCLLMASEKNHALVIGCEILSKLINFDDRGTAILFGDGAGAVVVEYNKQFTSYYDSLGVRGESDVLNITGVKKGQPSYVTMKGTAVYKFAVETVPKCLDAVLDKAKIKIADVDVFAFHQANARIIDAVAKRKKIPEEKIFKNIHKYGNTSAASVPIVLEEMYTSGMIKHGSRIMMLGFGAGLTWGGALIEYK